MRNRTLVLLPMLLAPAFPSQELAGHASGKQPRLLAPAESPLSGAAGAAGADESLAPTFRVERRLRVQSAWRDGSPAVAGVRVEVGVVDGSAGPRCVDLPVLGVGVSDAQGMLDVAFELPERWKGDEQANLWLRVASQGYRRWVCYPRLVPARGSRVEPFLKVLAQEGGTLFGSVVDAHGDRVAQARAWLFARERDGLRAVGATRTRPDGRFALDFEAAGTFVVHARSAAEGSGQLGAVRLDPAADPEPVTLSVGGGRPVAGRVLDPRGEPVRGARVLAIPEGHEAFPDAAACAALEQGGGLCANLATADEDGRLGWPALMPGRYAFHASLSSPRRGREDGFGTVARALGTFLGVRAVGATDDPLQLVFACHRIELAVVDHAGAAVPLPAPDELGRRVESPLSIDVLDEDGRPSFGSVPRVALDQGLLLSVEPERRYLLSWQDPAVPYQERTVSLSAGQYRLPVTLRLQAPGPAAELRIEVVDPQGHAFDEPIVDVFADESGREVASSLVIGQPGYTLAEAGRWSVALPPGSYRVEASAAPLGGCMVPEVLPRTPHGSAGAVVRLAAGEQRLLRLELTPAGHLDFAAAGPGAGRALLVERFLSAQDAERVAQVLGGGRAFLVGADGRRQAVGSLDVEGGHPLGQDWIVPGWAARSLDPLPPGAWTLWIEREGRVLFERAVTIVAGETTTVRW